MERKRKWKEVPESELLIRVAKKEFLGEDGKWYLDTEWEKADSEVSLGSLKNPNQSIVEIRYRFPQNVPSIFGGLLK